MNASRPSQLNIHESILVVNQGLQDNGMKSLSIIVVSGAITRGYYWDVRAMHCTEALWEAPLFFKVRHYLCSIISYRYFDVSVEKRVNYRFTNFVDNVARSRQANTKEMRDGPKFYIGAKPP